MHHLDRLIKTDQLDGTCFIISLFTAQHVSNVSIFIFRNLRLIVDLFHVLYCSGSMCVRCYSVVRLGWCGILMQAEALPYRTSSCVKELKDNNNLMFIGPCIILIVE